MVFAICRSLKLSTTSQSPGSVTELHNGVLILKFFLHISKDEQRKRLQSRLDDKQKRWKFSKADLAEREYWSDYQKAYNDALTLCNTDYAPWYIVPANKKWYRNLAVSRILRQTLEKMAPQYPPAEEGLDPAEREGAGREGSEGGIH